MTNRNTIEERTIYNAFYIIEHHPDWYILRTTKHHITLSAGVSLDNISKVIQDKVIQFKTLSRLEDHYEYSGLNTQMSPKARELHTQQYEERDTGLDTVVEEAVRQALDYLRDNSVLNKVKKTFKRPKVVKPHPATTVVEEKPFEMKSRRVKVIKPFAKCR